MAKTLKLMEGLSSDLLQRAALSFDKMSGVIVLTIWGAAIVLIVLALYTINLSTQIQREVETAEAAEPNLPKIERKNVEREDMKKMADRMSKRYPVGLVLTPQPDGTLTIATTDPIYFGDWITSLSYLETLAPNVSWALEAFCVGPECRGDMMAASVSGKRITFSVAPVK